MIKNLFKSIASQLGLVANAEARASFSANPYVEGDAPKMEENTAQEGGLIGILGVDESLGFTIASQLLEAGRCPSDILCICYAENSFTESLSARGVTIAHVQDFSSYLDPSSTLYQDFVFIPSSQCSPNELLSVSNAVLDRCEGVDRAIKRIFYLMPQYDYAIHSPGMSVYLVIEHAVKVRAIKYLTFRHALLLDDVFNLAWVERALDEGKFCVRGGITRMNFCRVNEIAAAVVKMLQGGSLGTTYQGVYKYGIRRGHVALLSRPVTMLFTPRDVLDAFKRHFAVRLKYDQMDEARLEKQLFDRGLLPRRPMTMMYESACSLLSYDPKLYSFHSPSLEYLIGSDRIVTIDEYFADLAADYFASIK